MGGLPQFDAHLSNNQLIFSYSIINDIHLCEDTNHIHAAFRTGQRATHLVHAVGLGVHGHHVGDTIFCSVIDFHAYLNQEARSKFQLTSNRQH